MANVPSELTTIVNELLEESGRNPYPSLSRGMRLRGDLGLDSLDLAVLTVKLEAHFGVDVFADGLVVTLGEVEDRLLGR